MHQKQETATSLHYSFNKIVLDIITEKFDIQVDENTKTQAALLNNDIPGTTYPL